MKYGVPIYSQSVFGPAKAWRERYGRYRLTGTRCLDCGSKFFPRSHNCENCGSARLESYDCAQSGVVIGGWPPPEITTPTGFGDQMPRYVVLVKLDDGVHVKGEMVEVGEDQLEPALEGFDLKKPKEGLRVSVVIRRLRRESNGNWLYGYKFIPEN